MEMYVLIRGMTEFYLELFDRKHQPRLQFRALKYRIIPHKSQSGLVSLNCWLEIRAYNLSVSTHGDEVFMDSVGELASLSQIYI